MYDVITKTAYELGWIQQGSKHAASSLRTAHKLKDWNMVLAIAQSLEEHINEAAAKAEAFAKDSQKKLEEHIAATQRPM